MRSRRAAWQAVGTVLCAVSVVGSLALEGRQRPRPGSSTPPSPDDVLPSKGTIIAEVLFAPERGSYPYIELLNAGKAAVEIGTMSLRIGPHELPLGFIVEPLVPGARLLVVFDGGGKVERNVLHAPKDLTVPDESGFVELRNYRDDLIDRVAWGVDAGAVQTVGDAPGVGLARGSTIGRPTGANRPMLFTEWVVYEPADATPGAPNPAPAVLVTDLSPMSGSVFKDPAVMLSWVPLPGVSQYRVQIAADRSFGSPTFDRVIDDTRVDVRLDPGRHFWRVQSVGVAGRPAAYSVPASLWIGAVPRAPERPRFTGGGPAASPVLASLARRTTDITGLGPQASEQGNLNVPLIHQRKDSRMLQLENREPTGPHAWNAAHSTRSAASDPADTWNCALANVAMVNHTFGGDLSQDRIGYEMLSRNVTKYQQLFTSGPNAAVNPIAAQLLREHTPGPEWDLSYGNGISGIQIIAALAYALDGIPRFRRGSEFKTADSLWAFIKEEIDAGRPVITGRGSHTVTIRAYLAGSGLRFLFVNDPVQWGVSIPVEILFDDAENQMWRVNNDFWLMPLDVQLGDGVKHEPNFSTDADKDRVTDFDEVERFLTDPRNPDSDGDGVRDFEDIASSVFEVKHGHGYAYTHAVGGPGRDYDHDQLPPERDVDSDGGGCNDGVEDRDKDGMYEAGETSNFDDTDEGCTGVDGVIRYTIIATSEFLGDNGGTAIKAYSSETVRITVRLKSDPDNPGTFVDDGSTFLASSSGNEVFLPGTGCPMFARVSLNGSGPFTQYGASIGGGWAGRGRPADALTIGANGETSGFGHTISCLGVGRGPLGGSFAMPECDGMLDGTGPGRYLFDCRAPAAATPLSNPKITYLYWGVYGHVRLQ